MKDYITDNETASSFNTALAQTIQIPTWIYLLIGALLVVLLILYISVHIYKRKAKEGEALLKKENEKLNALLSENEKLLKRHLTVFNTSLVGLSYFDKNGILVNINDRMITLFNQTNKDKFLEEQLSIYDISVIRSHGIIDKDNHIHEFHGILKYDTRSRQSYFKMDVIPIIDKNKNLEGILVTAIDQTTEVEHEQQMLEEEAKMNLALEAGNISAWIYDPHTQVFTTLNGNAVAGTGLSMEMNMNILHPDDRMMQKELFAAFLSGKKDRAEATFRYLNEDGTHHYYDSHMVTKKENGKVVAVLGTQKDMTKEVLNNKMLNDTVEKLRFAIQTAGMAMWEYDCSTQIFTSFNDPVADYQDAAPISMNTYISYFQKDGTNWEQLDKAIDIMKNGKDEAYTVIVKIKTQYDSEDQYCNIRAVPMEKDKNGKVTKYLGVRSNITDQMKYQKILEREREEAQKADKLKSMFLANMSHEIRTPLNAIVGFSELLQTTEEPEMRTEFINIIHKNNELLLRLISDILDLSKIESGLLELKIEEFDLSATFKETFTALKQRSTNPEVAFLEHNPYKSCKVKLDRNRLVQVGTNFITNAIKHTTQGHILMGYEYTDGGIRIYVEDTGCGIAKDKQGQLFQRFAKLDDFTQGTGLGLAISKAIADALGGKIGVESEEGKGSTFWAWFPCEAEIEQTLEDKQIEEMNVNAAAKPIKDNPQDPPTGSLQTLSVLVAEDIDSNYMLVKAILKGFELTRAKTGKEAVELVSACHYDAILMDMKMPVMGGLEATRKIREFDKSTPIIAVTANAFDSDKEAALKAGCNAFMAKPFKKRELEDLFKKQ